MPISSRNGPAPTASSSTSRTPAGKARTERLARLETLSAVIPAKAGIQGRRGLQRLHWTPAFAGVTIIVGGNGHDRQFHDLRRDGRERRVAQPGWRGELAAGRQ